MKQLATLFLFLSFQSFLISQSYFQQQVDYNMDVSLDTATHVYTGQAEISYTNNSSDELNEIYFHVWANSYSSTQSAFGKQQLRMNQKKFQFHKDEDGGGYQDLSFNVENIDLEFIYHEDNPDIVLVQLNEAVKPGETIVINTNFSVKVPIFFSRMGRQEGYYQVTQWFPKPAVYDIEGWHQMPYLDMGEFFSEFGKYNVNITVPSNYQVASTGNLTSVNENEATSTFSYEAENVHDFAWCAYHDFKIQKDKVELPTGEIIDLYVYEFDDYDTWENAMEYLKNAILFYSKEVGAYPYLQATVVQSPGGTGGGMEYPMLTTIDTRNSAQAVDHVIAHEVGHNWFYGILASNERVNAWMDEGINSFYDHKYNDVFYKDGSHDDKLPKFLQGDSENTVTETATIWQCKRGRNQACSTHCSKLNTINYGLSAYEYPAMSLKYLEAYLGEELMSECTHAYYDQWKFKHPRPEDVEQVFEQTSGKDLDWFFKEIITSDGFMDHALTDLTATSATVKNKGQLNIPIRLDFQKDGEWVAHQWVESFSGSQTVNLEYSDFDKLAINGDVTYVDVNPANNIKSLNGSNFIKPKLKFLGQIDDPNRAELFYLPMIGYNVHNGFMPFLSIYNSAFPQKWTRFNGNFGYDFGSNRLVGTGNIEHDIMLNSSVFRKVMLGVNYRHFAYKTPQDNTDQLYWYHRIAPSISLFVNPYFDKQKEEWLKYTFINLHQNFGVDGIVPAELDETNNFHLLEFNRVVKTAMTPNRLKVSLMYHNYDSPVNEDSKFLKLTADFAGKLAYAEKSYFHYRVFAGYFPINTSRFVNSYNNVLAKGSLNLAYNERADVAFSEYWFGRSEQMRWTEQQIRTLEGGFKTPLIYNQGNLGKSNHALFSANFKSDIPVPLFNIIPIKPYLDLGVFASPLEDESFEWNFLYDAGVALEFFDGDLGIYLSLLQSDRLQQVYNAENFGRKISFQVNINRLRPWELIDQLEL